MDANHLSFQGTMYKGDAYGLFDDRVLNKSTKCSNLFIANLGFLRASLCAFENPGGPVVVKWYVTFMITHGSSSCVL